MDRMKALWEKSTGIPSVKDRLEVVKKFAEEILPLGPANFLYSDGDAFFAHGDERHDPLTNKITWPGLHYTQLKCQNRIRTFCKTRESGVSIETRDDNITLFASVPLDEGEWIPLHRGEVLAVCKGKIVS